MEKLFDSFEYKDEPIIRVIEEGDSGLEKSAATGEITQFLAGLQKKPGHSYLHILALSAGEYAGSNRNGDFFPEDNLKACYKTFETTPARIYRHHINKDTDKSYGVVIFACYNEVMHRVELIAECPNDLIQDVNSRIAQGDFPATSMACMTPADTCSICGNVAHSKAEYCDHIRTQLNKLYPDGRRVMAVNNFPLRFKDQSFVIKPADVTSSVLVKVAEQERVIGSAELAELAGLNEKSAAFKKVSELIKEISDAKIVQSIPGIDENILSKTSDLPIAMAHLLGKLEVSHVLAGLSHRGISPSLEFLAELIAQNHLGEGYEGIGQLAADYTRRALLDPSIPEMEFDHVKPEEVNPQVYVAIDPYIERCSLLPGAVEKRASNIGFSGNGPHIEPLPGELARNSVSSQVSSSGAKLVPSTNISESELAMFEKNYGKLLLTLGISALLAKGFIHSEVQRKLRKEENETNPKNPVKIVLVKSASDRGIGIALSKAAFLKAASEIESFHSQVMATAPKAPEDTSDGNNISPQRAAVKATRRMLSETKTPIGGKLSTLIKVVNLGQKVL